MGGSYKVLLPLLVGGGVFIDGGLAGALTHKSSGSPSQRSTEATWGRWVAKPTLAVMWQCPPSPARVASERGCSDRRLK